MFSLALVPAIFAAVVSFTILQFLTVKIRVSAFDSMGFLNVTASFSLAMLFSLYALKQVGLSDLINISLFYFFFYFGVYVVAQRYGGVVEKSINTQSFRLMLESDAVARVNVYIIGLGLVIITLTFSFMLISSGQMPDDRIVLAKSFRAVDVVKQGFLIIFPYYVLGMYLVVGRRFYLYLALAAMLVGFFSGSKGFLLSYLMAYFTLDGLLNGRRNLVETLKKSYLLVLAFVGAILVKVFWGDGFISALYGMVYRLFASGDVYYYAYVTGDYRTLFDKYEFFPYLLHPFTSLVGVRGYDWPLGVALFEQATGDASGYGPNAQLPILAVVLFKGNYYAAFGAAAVAGAFVAASRVLALKIVSSSVVPPFWRISFFSVFFGFVTTLFVDIGMFEQGLIGSVFVALILSVFYEVLGVRYSKSGMRYYKKIS